MKRRVCPKKALAVILSAAMAFSPAITASATAPEALTAETAEAKEAGETKEAGEAAGEEASSEEKEPEKAAEEETKEASEEAGAAEDAAEKEAEEKADEAAKEAAVSEEGEEGELVFEKVDPTEEGLELSEGKDLIEGEATDFSVATPDPDEQTRVIIVMEGDSVLDAGFDTETLAENDAAMTMSDNIIAEQEVQVEKIEAQALDGAELDVNYNLSILTNAVSADVAFKDIESIAEVEGVEAVYVAQKYEPQATDAEINTITAGDMVGSYDAWTTGYTGAGTRIAVIDTGIDADHPSFDGGAFDAHLQVTAEKAGKSVADYSLLDESEIAAVLPNLNATQRNGGISASDLYLSEKIPFAFNYVDKDLDITHANDEEGDHGTHVSGIATANTYVPSAASETGYARQELGVVGVAPDAQLITMKVFGKGGGAYSDDYMAAIEDALLLKADVVNLSLGSSAAGYSSDAEAYINDIFKKLEGTGTVVSISAGNSGRFGDDTAVGANLSWDVNMDTIGSPGSYYNAFTVASAVNSGFTGNYLATTNGKNIYYTDGNDTLAPKFYTLDVSADGKGTEYPFVFIDGKGAASDYEALVDENGESLVKDKIVFVQRGELTFGEKQMNAEAAGAKAVVIYNNQPGTISMTLQGSTAVIPAVSVTLDEGLGVAETATEQISEKACAGTLTVVATPATNFEAADGYTMSDFSSVGVPETLDLKPEITAPGGNIYSTRDGGTYGNMSGTSMSAPSIAGQTALVEQYIKENDLAAKTGLSVRTLAQSLIMSTATPLTTGNDASAPEYSPRSQGAGLANVHEAVTSPAYVLVGDKAGNDGKVKVVLGDDPSRNGSYNFSFDVYNLTDEPQYYELDSSVLTEELIQNYFIMCESHKLSPEVTLTADDTALVYDLNYDGRVDKKDRKVLLQVVNGSLDLNLVSQNEDDFDFNADGIVDTKDVYIFGKQLKKKDSVVDLGRRVMQVKDSTKVNVSINLSAADREYLAQFENGMYVDGFIYVNGAVDLSVPFLAFYGSWMDSSMFEDFDFMASRHDPEYDGFTYSGVTATNFLSIYPFGDTSEENEMFYVPNLFAKDAKYIADRNAISSDPKMGTVLGSLYYSLIRNASRSILTITDKNTGEEYFKNINYENYAEFSYNGQIENYWQTQDLFWAGTDAEGNPLEDGTEVLINLQAVPSYYDDVEDPSTLDGKGLYLPSTPIAIDNTAPEITGYVLNEDGTLGIQVQDNRYTAAVLILNAEGQIIDRYAVNQETKGEEATVNIKMPEGTFYIDVVDYALNESVFRFTNNTKKSEDVTEPTDNTEKTDEALADEAEEKPAEETTEDDSDKKVTDEAISNEDASSASSETADAADLTAEEESDEQEEDVEEVPAASSADEETSKELGGNE
ncbi:S8 family serine peptidase [Butyrivibrio sp. FCS014]|uniref:S8 family serine peptidase n=1 Tax=Butyrivibrio sp. FCS014 TaxID=1408304 RepID=UPI00046735F4|nr:S8 family serine peptidase [Butyrivibrio sp. FCS014]